MQCRIGLISDVHATLAPVEHALSIFHQHKVDQVICAGDIAGYGDELQQTIDALIRSGCYAIAGNHDLWHCNETPDENCDFLLQLPASYAMQYAGIELYAVHARPPDKNMGGIHLLDEQGRLIDQQMNYWCDYLADFPYDVLVTGHTHQVFAEMIAGTLVINPGSTKFNHSCAILTLPEMEIEFHALNGKTILKSWNWGAYRAGLYDD